MFYFSYFLKKNSLTTTMIPVMNNAVSMIKSELLFCLCLPGGNHATLRPQQPLLVFQAFLEQQLVENTALS